MSSTPKIIQTKIRPLDYIIVGAGPVGLYCAMKLSLLKKNFLVIEKNQKIGGQPSLLYPTKPVYNLPGIKKILGSDICKRFHVNLTHRIFKKTIIEKITSAQNNVSVKLSTGRTFISGKLILCSGLGNYKLIELKIPGKKKNVLYSLKKINTFANKDIVILGSGYSAVNWAIQISSIARSVTLVTNSLKLESTDKEIKNLKHEQIRYLLGWDVKQIIGFNSLEIWNIKTKSKEVLPFDYILVQYGFQTEHSSYSCFGNKIKMKCNKVIVDTNYKTNLSNIYACGDCCVYKNKLYNIHEGMKEVDKIINL
ncbi:MAG: NAD(P)/FAD-dependent oxidoreductase [Mycoplasmoidaceae bacterium]|nr:MAG: NAD(P)/FAD-dependent oxidoreductase [Mycoplasmoidaceae bacterium]